MKALLYLAGGFFGVGVSSLSDEPQLFTLGWWVVSALLVWYYEKRKGTSREERRRTLGELGVGPFVFVAGACLGLGLVYLVRDFWLERHFWLHHDLWFFLNHSPWLPDIGLFAFSAYLMRGVFRWEKAQRERTRLLRTLHDDD